MIHRAIVPLIEQHLRNPEITLIVGARQVGKTFLMQTVRQNLEKQGERTTFLNLDIEEDAQFFTSQSRLVEKIKLQLGNSRGYVFIDEIQRKENAGVFLKGLFDMNLPYKMIVSGSGSLELKEKIHESLSGRKRIFELTPLTFTEFVDFETTYRFSGKLHAFFSVERAQTQALLEHYMNFGGYPKVVLSTTLDEKQAAIREIYQSYIEKDIKDLLKLEKTEAFIKLVKVLASQIGGLVNVSELSSTVGLAVQTVQHYLWYLEKTFIVRRVSPFFRNTRKEITKAPLYYFYDTGLRNYIAGFFGAPAAGPLAGHLFENVVCNRIFESVDSSAATVHFWRTRDHAEVDFVRQNGMDAIPFEVKCSSLKKPTVPVPLRHFLRLYKPKTAYIIHHGERMSAETEGATVLFVPFWEDISI